MGPLMTTHVLTVDTTAVMDTEAYTSEQTEGGVAGLLGAWATKFGRLNQTLFLQDEKAPLPPLARDRRLQLRERQVLSVENPFRVHDPSIRVYELRVYDMYIGMADAFLKELIGVLPVRERYTPNFGIWRSLSGRVDQVLHLWGYGSVEERDAVRDRVSADKDWQAYVAIILPMIQSMQSSLLVPLPVQARD